MNGVPNSVEPRWRPQRRRLRAPVAPVQGLPTGPEQKAGDVRLDTTRLSHPDGINAAASLPPDEGTSSEELLPYRDARASALERFEKDYLSAVVERCGTKASAAARLAQMDRNYLVSLLRKHGLR
ncbi:MAG: hypothetical protein AAGF12_43255 [Myxococcota bacterium]